MPDCKTGQLDDNGKDIYHACLVARQFRQELYDEIVKEFNAVMEQEEQHMVSQSYDYTRK